MFPPIRIRLPCTRNLRSGPLFVPLGKRLPHTNLMKEASKKQFCKNISQKWNCFFKSLDMLSCERLKADLAGDRNALQTIEKIFVFHSVGLLSHYIDIKLLR